jgi:hypothetical protein
MLPEKTDPGTRYQVLPQVTDSHFRRASISCRVPAKQHAQRFSISV